MKTRLAFGLFLLATATAGLAEPHRAGTLSFSPSTLTINAPAGVPSIGTSNPVTLSSSGGKVTWHAAVLEPGATWLSVTPTDGTLNGSGSVQLNIKVDVMSPVQLVSGTYNGTIRVTGNQSNSPLDLPVTLVVDPNAVIQVFPSSLSFAAPTGVKPADQSFTLHNGGSSNLAWAASVSYPGAPTGWIHVSPANSSAAGGDLVPGGDVPITVSVDSQASPNTYSGTVTITNTNNPAKTKAVSIDFIVSSLGRIALSPASLTFDAPTGGGDPTIQFLSLSNTGGQNLNWSVAVSIDTPPTPTGWLSVDAPLSGTLAPGAPQALTVRIDNSPGGTSLPEGTYKGTVTVSGTSGGNPVTSKSASITLNVNSNPQLSATPDTASFLVSVDSAVSTPIGISVLNSGSGTLGWTVGGGPSWLAVSPFPPASNSPQTISLSMTVVKSTKPTDAPAGQCGLSGLEGLIPVLAFLIRRRVSKRGAVA